MNTTDTPEYNNEIIKLFTLAAVFWGVAGFLVGVIIALQMAFPQLNFEPYLTFGRLRPLHTSAVIFAFGENVLFAISYFCLQRNCRARLWGDSWSSFTFWGYQAFILMAWPGYLGGVRRGKEYTEPEWYADLWLTIVWVAYLIIFLMTLARRKEPHIYVAN
jgi:cytochrome c oxidase cbb3-type subunit 1